ncbi:hypothetical protein L1987_01043 [Smallanthus sonchifolius]|uniref:Uncharacterized protein n=1 Tax=Smallanthus sonchifolius TaxID=185202 RepID=A0ACB9K400_9ASTR|nr:hypothetical protein L1987_01043 [Smallanthus sonchifolius]
MENAYPGSNILVVTLTNEESKRVESQSDQETMREAREVLRNMFGPDVPEATNILVPRWYNNRFQCGSYSNYPIYANSQLVQTIKAPIGRIFFTGEHTSEKFNGYVHGGYLAGIDTGETLLEEMKNEKDRETNNESTNGVPLVARKKPRVEDTRRIWRCWNMPEFGLKIEREIGVVVVGRKDDQRRRWLGRGLEFVFS